jgi:hypothetical protein
LQRIQVLEMKIVRGGAPLKVLRWYVILMLLGLSSSAAMADGIDPALGVRGGGDQTLWPGSVTFAITPQTASCDTTCNFTTPAFFINAGTITEFELTFDTPQGVFSVEEGSAFPNLTTVLPGIEALLSGGTIFPAEVCAEICEPGPNQVFGNFVLDMEGVTLGSNGETLVTVSSVPEPETLILVLSGLGFLGLRRLRSKEVPS